MDNLRNKLIAGKNEHQGGYQKFATAQFYGKSNMPYTMSSPIDALVINHDINMTNLSDV